MRDRFWIVARDKPGLLMAMMNLLAGDARISFEGDLGRCRGIYDEPGASGEETGELRRHTSSPDQDFAVLPLEPDTIQPILRHVLPESRLMHDVIHIQIEKSGRLEFGTYDNFHDECIVCGTAVPTPLLEQLREKHVIRSWVRPPRDARRWHG